MWFKNFTKLYKAFQADRQTDRQTDRQDPDRHGRNNLVHTSGAKNYCLSVLFPAAPLRGGLSGRPAAGSARVLLIRVETTNRSVEGTLGDSL